MLRWQIFTKRSRSLEKDRTHANRFQTESFESQPLEQVDQPASHANEPENLVEKEELVEEVAAAMINCPNEKEW